MIKKLILREMLVHEVSIAAEGNDVDPVFVPRDR
jgi:hypothetical protein